MGYSIAQIWWLIILFSFSNDHFGIKFWVIWLHLRTPAKTIQVGPPFTIAELGEHNSRTYGLWFICIYIYILYIYKIIIYIYIYTYRVSMGFLLTKKHHWGRWRCILRMGDLTGEVNIPGAFERVVRAVGVERDQYLDDDDGTSWVVHCR